METVDCLVLIRRPRRRLRGIQSASLDALDRSLSGEPLRQHCPHRGNAGRNATSDDKGRRSRAGWVFITNRKMPNPYDGLPDYWAEEIEDVAPNVFPE